MDLSPVFTVIGWGTAEGRPRAVISAIGIHAHSGRQYESV